jgi:ferrous iron transport protein A
MSTESVELQRPNGVEQIPMLLLQPGQSGLVCDVVGDSQLVHRLREMGLYGGVEVKMIRAGSPCIIGLGRQRLGIRVDELASILVRIPAVVS